MRRSRLAPDNDKRVVTIEILRRSTVEEQAPVDEAELILAAEQVFLDLDRRELGQRAS